VADGRFSPVREPAGAGIIGAHREPQIIPLYQLTPDRANPGHVRVGTIRLSRIDRGLDPGWQLSGPMLRSTRIRASTNDGDTGRAKEDRVSTRIYEGHGVRFAYPPDWALEETDEGEVATVEVQAPGGLAFAFVRVDESGLDPASVTDEVLEAMRQEYPDLDVSPALETIAGHHATGYDVEFFSLDFTNGAAIRSFQTPERTVLIFGQWSDIDDDRLPDLIRGVFRSVEELED
jgi:hypothetical protein